MRCVPSLARITGAKAFSKAEEMMPCRDGTFPHDSYPLPTRTLRDEALNGSGTNVRMEILTRAARIPVGLLGQGAPFRRHHPHTPWRSCPYELHTPNRVGNRSAAPMAECLGQDMIGPSSGVAFCLSYGLARRQKLSSERPRG